MARSFQVVGIGEMLWDLFPQGRRLGGAPTNFCYHCHQLGAESFPVSAVGSDELGRDILEVLRSKGLPCEHVAVDEAHPTGTVRVTLLDGKPEYEICEGVAWDHIPMSAGLASLSARADAVCFGSLAQRSRVSRATIQSFLGAMRPDALRIFDVNLRQHFHSEEVLRDSLARCNVLKVSDEELPVLAGLWGLSGSDENQLIALRALHGLRLIAFTRGAHGSMLVTAEGIEDHPGYPAEALNTVGAGDSFTAALCMGLLYRRTLAEISDTANRVAAFVCTQDGATPVLPELIRCRYRMV